MCCGRWRPSGCRPATAAACGRRCKERRLSGAQAAGRRRKRRNAACTSRAAPQACVLIERAHSPVTPVCGTRSGCNELAELGPQRGPAGLQLCLQRGHSVRTSKMCWRGKEEAREQPHPARIGRAVHRPARHACRPRGHPGTCCAQQNAPLVFQRGGTCNSIQYKLYQGSTNAQCSSTATQRCPAQETAAVTPRSHARPASAAAAPAPAARR